MKKIYFDLDDVGNDFLCVLVNKYNRDYQDSFDWRKSRYSNIWDNGEIKADKEYFVQKMAEENMFYHPKPTEGFVRCIKKLISEGYEVKIVTYPQWESQFCVNEKIIWIREHLPFFDIENVIMTKHKGEVAKAGKILLDDKPEHLKEWQDNGGIAVSFARAEYSKKWEGRKVSDFDEFYELIKLLN